MQITKEEADQEMRRVPIRTLAIILFAVLTSTLIASASSQPPTPLLRARICGNSGLFGVCKPQHSA